MDSSQLIRTEDRARKNPNRERLGFHDWWAGVYHIIAGEPHQCWFYRVDGFAVAPNVAPKRVTLPIAAVARSDACFRK